MTDDARKLIDRFQAVYPFDAFTRARATASVTTLAKNSAEAAGPVSSLQRKLDIPEFFQRDALPKATDIGNATHALLQYFNFAADPSLPEINRQITDLVNRKFLPPEYAKLVDRDAVQWFLQSELGILIRANHANLIREVPFALMRPADDCPSSGDPADQIMIRGRIDLLIPAPAGLTIVDYKTDKVSGPDLDHRVETYSRQMRFYAEAIRKVARHKIASIYLVFLSPRRFVACKEF
jgi:ATP-dependent helicase/nuclease subunit A